MERGVDRRDTRRSAAGPAAAGSCRDAAGSSSSSGVSSCSSTDAGTRVQSEVRGHSGKPHMTLTQALPHTTQATMTHDNGQVMMSGGEPRLSLVFLPHNQSDDSVASLNLYQPLVDLISSDLQILASANQNPLQHPSCMGTPPARALDMPSSALVLQFREGGQGEGEDRLVQGLEYVTQSPWRFHHSEWVGGPGMQAHPHSSQDFYLAHQDLPLCSLTQSTGSKEHLRIVKFVSEQHWKDSIPLYSQILGQKPDSVKSDSCIYMLENHGGFDVQFSLKKLPRNVVPRSTRRLVLSFRVGDVGGLVPLLPAPCQQLSSSHWATVDFDGNEIFLEQCPILEQQQQQHGRLFMGHTMPLYAISEDQRQSEPRDLDTEDDTSTVSFLCRGDYNQVLTSTPVAAHRSHQRHRERPKKTQHHHQHTDSGYSEGRSEPSRSADIRNAVTQFCDVSLSELMSSGDDKSEGSVPSRAPQEVDMTVRSAYKDGTVDSLYSALPSTRQVPERLRPGHLHQENKVNVADLDPKQSFTQLWVMNGHREVGGPRETVSDNESICSVSSLDTALSDPFSDRGDFLAMKTRDRPLMPELCSPNDGSRTLQEVHEEAIDVPGSLPAMPTLTSLLRPEHRDSSSVTSSEGTGRRRNKGKKVSFSATVQEHMVSPRVVVTDQSPLRPASQARQAKVQAIIDRIQGIEPPPHPPAPQPPSHSQPPSHPPPPLPDTAPPPPPTTPSKTQQQQQQQQQQLGFWI